MSADANSLEKPPADPLESDVARSIAGDADATRRLISALRPVVHARVARALRNNPRAWNRDPREEVSELTQEIFLLLFKDRGALLARWRPDGGLSIRNYVGLVAYRRATGMLVRRGSKWQAEPDEGSRLEGAAGSVSNNRAIEQRNLLHAMVAALRSDLSARQFELFTALVLKEESIDTLSVTFGMSANALYTARSRFLNRARKILAQLDEDPSETARGS